MGLAGHADPIEDAVAVPGRDLSLLRPRSRVASLDHWAEVWPSATALACHVAPRALRGACTLELGCGLGLVSVAAALAGARVTASDRSPESVEFALANAERNGASVEGLVCSWAEPAALLERAPWQLVLGSDLLYERRNGDLLLDLLPRLVGERGEVWIADPGRATAAPFFEASARVWEIRSSGDPHLPSVTIHRLRLLPSSGENGPSKQQEGSPMAKVVNCECGTTVRGESDDELVARVAEHVQQEHPDMVGKMSRDDVLAMAEEE